MITTTRYDSVAHAHRLAAVDRMPPPAVPARACAWCRAPLTVSRQPYDPRPAWDLITVSGETAVVCRDGCMASS